MIRRNRAEKYLPHLLLAAIAALGFLNIPNIGISWDEPGQRLSAGLSVINVVNKVAPGLVPSGYSEFSNQADDLSKNGAVDHGVAFDAPILILETVLGIDSTRDIYLLHHTINWIGYLVGLVSIYLISLKIYERRKIALLSGAMFLLSPRILAEGFYNSKDITFLSFLLLASYFLIRSWEKKDRVLFAILAGIASGYATDIRILGLVQLPIVSLIYLIIFVGDAQNLKIWLRKYLVFLGSYCLTVYALFPYLWSNPVLNLIKVFKSMSKYNWDGNVLYAGDRILAHDLPWHYIPVWIGITTPILYLVFFVVGLLASVLSLSKGIQSRQSLMNERNNIFVLLSLFIPLLAIIGLHSTLYDGWRHMYFIYPYIILLATQGYIWLEQSLKSKKVILEIGSWALIGVVLMWVLTNNPRQNLYFNAFAGNDISDNWEMDYWGLSNESALRYILENDQRSKITVQEVSFTPLEVSSKMLNETEQSRLIFQRNKTLSADYIVNNFRSGSTESIPTTFAGYMSLKKFKVDGFTYLEILKRIS
jgi:hypothetical protein